MVNGYLNCQDTIVAISSAVGSAARGIIRLSGPGAVASAGKFFQADEASDSKTDIARAGRYYGTVRPAESINCPGQLYIFCAPHSFSGEDMAELHVPGSAALLRMLLEGLLAAGVRQAQPGEFTARAFFNGRIDLSEAEAVASVINARSDAQLRGAQRLLDGALHYRCCELTDQVTDILALVEAGIDFSDQDIELAGAGQLTGKIETVRAELQRLWEESIGWEELNVLPQVAVAGAANAGKSTLTNALLGMDRSIVASIAGTTRDLLTAPLHLKHGECLLIDTAGLGPIKEDLLAEVAQNRARQAVSGCDLLLWVVDVSDARQVGEIQDDLALLNRFVRPTRVLVTANKADLCQDRAARQEMVSQMCRLPAIMVSAWRGDNLAELKGRIEAILHGGGPECSSDILALTARQKEELRQAEGALSQALNLVVEGGLEQAELVALELRGGLDHLAAISGEVVTEEILGAIFRRFCVGK